MKMGNKEISNDTCGDLGSIPQVPVPVKWPVSFPVASSHQAGCGNSLSVASEGALEKLT